MKKYPYHFVLHNKEQGLIGIIEYNGDSIKFNNLVHESLGNHFDLKDDLIAFNEIMTYKLEIEFEIELHALIDDNSEIFFLEKTALYKK